MLQWGRPFYGAESLRSSQMPRSFHLLNLLQWGRPFYGAESGVSVWRVRVATPCFNGAALFTGRRESSCVDRCWLRVGALRASMGPPFLRGGEPSQQAALLSSLDLLASMGPPFLRGGEDINYFMQIEVVQQSCFNGAALFTGRREIIRQLLGSKVENTLQWGRPFYGAESGQKKK